MNSAQLRDALVTRLQSLPRRARMARGHRVRVEEGELLSDAGTPTAWRLHLPQCAGPLPAVLLCPGTNDGMDTFQGWRQPLNASEVTGMGFAVATFDPAGRGASWGEEDYGGPEHQDQVQRVLEALATHPQVDPTRVLVVSISLGLSMAAGALIDPPVSVRALIDWEGPSDREIITAGGTRMAPALGHKLDDEAYWRPREGVRALDRLRCGYWRLQAERDHAQPGELRHAERMIQAAEASSTLRWFRLNGHEPGELPERPQWGASGRSAANKALLRAIKQAAGVA